MYYYQTCPHLGFPICRFDSYGQEEIDEERKWLTFRLRPPAPPFSAILSYIWNWLKTHAVLCCSLPNIITFYFLYGYGSLKQRITCLLIDFDQTTKLLQRGVLVALNVVDDLPFVQFEVIMISTEQGLLFVSGSREICLNLFSTGRQQCIFRAIPFEILRVGRNGKKKTIKVGDNRCQRPIHPLLLAII